jgi:hypothetical protein
VVSVGRWDARQLKFQARVDFGDGPNFRKSILLGGFGFVILACCYRSGAVQRCSRIWPDQVANCRREFSVFAVRA